MRLLVARRTCAREACSSASASLSRTSAAVSATGIEPRVPQKRTRMAASAFLERRRRASADTAPSASRTVGKTWNTRLKWLISKISATIGCSAATKMRPCCALAWREASMKQRSPAEDTYSRPERSTHDRARRVRGVELRLHAAAECLDVSWSRRPAGASTSTSAMERGFRFILFWVF